MRALLLLAVTATVAIPAAGCGGSDSGGADRPPATRPLTKQQLRARLLTVADLPPGYRRSADDGRDDTRVKSDNRRCEQVLNAEDDLAVADVDASFDRGDLGPFLLESLSSYPRGKARQDFARSRRALAGCGTVRFDDPEIRGTMTLRRTPFPDLGDETLAYALDGRLSAQGLSLPVHGEIAAVRIGDNEIGVFAFAIGPGGGPNVEALARTAVRRFRTRGATTA